MHKAESVIVNETQRILLNFEIQKSPNPGQTTRPRENYQKEKNKTKQNKKEKKSSCYIADFAVPVDHRVKIKESEKRDKYLDLVRELKKSCGT